MTVRKGIDYYAMAPSEAKAVGASFVCRYLSLTPGKSLTLGEARELSRLGISMVVVWETTAKRALDGEAAGAEDARVALAQATACGMPAGRPIYFSVDYDTSEDPSVVEPYFVGAAGVTNPIGVYGGISTVKYLFDAKRVEYGWQTEAWSGGRFDWRAQIRQVAYGANYDTDSAWANDYGQWLVAP
jgi:hypothetical protein